MSNQLLETENELEEIVWDDRDPFTRSTDFYFKPKSFERSGKLYEALGIKPFKKLLLGTVGRLLKKTGFDNSPNSYFIGKGEKQNISLYESFSRFTEAAHMAVVLFSTGDLIGSLPDGNVGSIRGAAASVLINGYLVMLQRYNRARTYRILEERWER